MKKIFVFALKDKLRTAMILLLIPAILMGVVFMLVAATFIDGFLFVLFLETFCLCLAGAAAFLYWAAAEAYEKIKA